MKDTIKIILINRKIETQLQQTTSFRFSSSILTVTGKSSFHFSKFYNTNRALEPNIPDPEHATMIQINQNKFYFVLLLSRVVLVLSRVVSFCTRVVSCCLVLGRVFTRKAF